MSLLKGGGALKEKQKRERERQRCDKMLSYVIYLLCKISKEYNFEIAAKKTKVFGFVRTDHLRTKIITNDETPEQISQITSLSFSMSYQFSSDVEFKLAKFFTINRYY